MSERTASREGTDRIECPVCEQPAISVTEVEKNPLDDFECSNCEVTLCV